MIIVGSGDDLKSFFAQLYASFDALAIAWHHWSRPLIILLA